MHISKSEKWYYCGPASLQMALASLGVKRSQSVIAELCKTTKERGTSNRRLVSVAKRLGLETFVVERTSWPLLRSLVKAENAVIVGWYSDFTEPFGSHFSVVEKVSADSITLLDPEIGRRRRLTKVAFVRRWYDYDSADRRKLTRWVAVFHRPAPR